MYLHLSIPGFHAAAHQAADQALRGRPVAVAVDAGEQAPLFAVSLEGRAAGVWPGMRAAVARRRCPALAVVTPDPELYRRTQRAVAELCAGYTPRVGGGAGRIDADLDGTEALWRTRLRPGTVIDDALEQAILVARELVRASHERLRLRAFAGAADRLGAARVAARLAREPAYARLAVVGVAAAHERALLDPLPVSWLRECPPAAAQALDDCGVATIGEARELGVTGLARLLGDDAAAVLGALGEADEPLVPELADPEPSIAVACHCGDAGAGPERAAIMLAQLARELGYALRTRSLACTSLTLEGRWLDGRGAAMAHHARRQLRHDDELAVVARELADKRARRVHWQRLSLVATGLVGAEDQLELFAPGRHHRLEDARDLLRRRFGGEVVAPVRQTMETTHAMAG